MSELIDQHELKIELPKGQRVKDLQLALDRVVEKYGPGLLLDKVDLRAVRSVPAEEKPAKVAK